MGKGVILELDLLRQIPYKRIFRSMSKGEKAEIKKINGRIFRRREVIVKKNTSRVFTQIYQAIYGGGVDLNGDPGMEMNGFESRRFSPDITRRDHLGKHSIEVKATSRRIYDPSFRLDQAENYCFSFLESLFGGDLAPSVDYGFFNYGPWKRLGWGNFNNDKLVEKLSGQVNHLTIVPLNLLFFLSLFLSEQERDHTSSSSGVNSQRFLRIRGSMLKKIREEVDPFPSFVQEYFNPSFEELQRRRTYFGTEEEAIKAFSLDKMKIEKTSSPDLTLGYGGAEYPLKPFRMTRCFLQNEDYKEWLSYFQENHRRILENLNLDDLFGQSLDHDEGYFPEGDETYVSALTNEENTTPEVEDGIPF